MKNNKNRTEGEYYRSKQFTDSYKEEINKCWALGLPVTWQQDDGTIIQEYKDGRKKILKVGIKRTGKSTK